MRDTQVERCAFDSALMPGLCLTRLEAASDVAPGDTVSRTEHESVRDQLAAEVSRLTQLLQGALRKQDDMALDAADAWQKVRGQEVPRCPQEDTSISRSPPPPLCNPGTGARRPAGSPAGAGHLQGGAEPGAELQVGRVPGRRVSA